jgi:hypothetical protein
MMEDLVSSLPPQVRTSVDGLLRRPASTRDHMEIRDRFLADEQAVSDRFPSTEKEAA